MDVSKSLWQNVVRRAVWVCLTAGQQSRMLKLEVVHSDGCGWTCRVTISTGHLFWLAGYNGWVSPLTFGSEAAAGAEVKRFKAALQGQIVQELAAGVTSWTVIEEAELSSEGSFAVFSVRNRYATQDDDFAPLLVMFDLEFLNATLFENEAELVSAVESLSIKY